MSRESEVATLLRADSALVVLLPGGLYSYASLSPAGITDRTATPDVWTGGVFNTCAIVRQRSPVPTGQLADVKTQTTDINQVVEVYVYARTIAAIEPPQDRIYALLMGHAFSAAWPAEYALGIGPQDAPELPAGTKVERADYRIRSFKTAA